MWRKPSRPRTRRSPRPTSKSARLFFLEAAFPGRARPALPRCTTPSARFSLPQPSARRVPIRGSSSTRLKGKAAASATQALPDKALVQRSAPRRATGGASHQTTVASFAGVRPRPGPARVAELVSDDPVHQEMDEHLLQHVGPGSRPGTRPAPRGQQLSQAIALLGRDRGASVAELMAATGWLLQTTGRR